MNRLTAVFAATPRHGPGATPVHPSDTGDATPAEPTPPRVGEPVATAARPASRRRRRARWMAAASLVALAVVAGTMWLTRRGQADTTVPAQQIATAGLTTEQRAVSANGTFAPRSQASASFGVSGAVTSVSVTVGQKVGKGSVLAAIDSTVLRQAVIVAEANVEAARSALSSAQSASSSSVQTTSARAQLAAAQAQLTQARRQLEDAQLTSPIAGIVAAVNLNVGDRVSAAGSSSGSAQGAGSSSASAQGSGSAASAGSSNASSAAQVIVITPGSWLVNATVSGTDIASVKPGMQAQITPTGSANLVFGTVRTVGVIGTASGGAATFPVTIAVTGNPAGLYIGGTSTVSIIVQQLNNILTVPTVALSTANGQTTVQKMVGGLPETTQVTVGQTFGSQTQVIAGLVAGDQVAFQGRSGFAGNGPGGGPGGGASSGTGVRGRGGAGGLGGLGGIAP